ncbi:MAG: hypothetical protein AAGF23_25265 [Acidobacteriota bacterium]
MASQAPATASTPQSAPGVGTDWARVSRQFTGILRLELRRQLFSRRALVLYFLALAPLGLVAIWAVSPFPTRYFSGPMEAAPFFAFIYTSYLGTSIFLSALILFMSLFRSEFLEKSLHYYFLTPVRRSVVVVGKYVAALIAAGGVYGISTALLYLATMSPWGLGELSRFLFRGPGLQHLLTYVGISVLGCVGYGAIFLLAGLIFRNPIVVGVLFTGWESINFMLPSWLKKLSVFFYLWSLFPIQLSDGPFAVLAEPTSPLVSVPGLLIFTGAVLTLASWRASTMEITYGGEE